MDAARGTAVLLKVFGGRTASQLGELGRVLVFTGRRVGGVPADISR
jgi:hypothetical protein